MVEIEHIIIVVIFNRHILKYLQEETPMHAKQLEWYILGHQYIFWIVFMSLLIRSYVSLLQALPRQAPLVLRVVNDSYQILSYFLLFLNACS